MISVSNLSAGYGKNTVIRGITAKANPGEFIALLGPNGSGKSTLMKTLCGLLTPASGMVTQNGNNIHDLSIKQRARQISYLAQSRLAAPAMTVNAVVELGRAPYRGRLGRISEDGRTAIDRAIERTDLESLTSRRFDSLSGGEQGRVLLARALAVNAPVLLADEPIAALDPYFQITMMDILKAEARNGKIVIAALHDLAFAHQYCDRIWVLHQGRLRTEGTPDAAFTHDVLKTVFGIAAPPKGFSIQTLAD